MDLSSDVVLAELALLEMYAEDMHRSMQTVQEKLTPPIDPRLVGAWEPMAYLQAHDAIIPPPGVTLPLNIKSDPVYYGYLARDRADPTVWLAAVRGTAGVAEWIIDGQFLWVPHPRAPGVHVEHGFWDIYNTMTLVALDGTPLDADAAKGISAKVGAGTLTVLGHSLGAALATYLTYDLAAHLGGRVQGCFFASPRTGDPAWATKFDQTVASYIVVNYVLDVVPYLPTRPAYATLPKVRVLEPHTADASVRLDVGCNHHVVCYCALLSYPTMLAATMDPQVDGPSRACIIGDKSTISLETSSMAAAVKFVASTPLHVSALFRGMFALNLDT